MFMMCATGLAIAIASYGGYSGPAGTATKAVTVDALAALLTVVAGLRAARQGGIWIYLVGAGMALTTGPTVVAQTAI